MTIIYNFVDMENNLIILVSAAAAGRGSSSGWGCAVAGPTVFRTFAISSTAAICTTSADALTSALGTLAVPSTVASSGLSTLAGSSLTNAGSSLFAFTDFTAGSTASAASLALHIPT